MHALGRRRCTWGTVLTRYQDLRVGNKYRIGRKIGSGSFGDIYLGMRDTRPPVHPRSD